MRFHQSAHNWFWFARWDRRVQLLSVCDDFGFLTPVRQAQTRISLGD